MFSPFVFFSFTFSLSHYRNRYQVSTNSYNLSLICLFPLTISHARSLLNSRKQSTRGRNEQCDVRKIFCFTVCHRVQLKVKCLTSGKWTSWWIFLYNHMNVLAKETNHSLVGQIRTIFAINYSIRRCFFYALVLQAENRSVTSFRRIHEHTNIWLTSEAPFCKNTEMFFSQR